MGGANVHLFWGFGGILWQNRPMRPVDLLNPTKNALKALAARPWAPLLGLALAATTLVPAHVQGQSERESRYPYDPACPWGRLANGKGMIHRCLSEDEAKRIASGAIAPTTSSAPSAPAVNPAAPPTPEPTPAAPPKDFTITVGPIRAAEGDITIGKLGKPLDRYKACVVENGGLEAARAKVVVSFLVQAERSRAEGAEVVRSSGISKKAAACIADVIDRRQVGTPTQPTTGAELTIELIAK